MPRYFFDIHDGSGFLRDTVGSQLDGAAQVRYEAMQALPAIARDEIPKDGDKQSFMVLVRDENNLVVYTATLAFVGLWLGDVPPPPPEEE